MSNRTYRAKTFESVHSIDDPKGVSWMTGYTLDMLPAHEPFVDPAHDHGDGCNHWGVFPVSTAELVGKKGAALALGDIFGVELNLSADQPSEVDPVIDGYYLPISDEELGL